jgi:hypothetical protein
MNMKDPGRLATRAAVVAAAVLMMTSACGSKNDQASSHPRVVDWPALRTLGIHQVETDGARTWVLTLVPSESGGNLFSVEHDTLSVKRVDINSRLGQIVAGGGQLWALPDDGHDLLFIDESTQDVRTRRLDVPCDLLGDPSGVVALGTLWLTCNGRISVYEPSGGGGKHVSAPRSSHLLASHDGVWVVADGALVGIGGVAKGRRVTVAGGEDTRLWKSDGDDAWAVDFGAQNKALIRVHLPSGTATRFTIPTGSDQIDDLAVGADDLWVVLREEPVLLRLDRAQPTRILERLDLRSEAPSDDSLLFVTAGASYAWIEMYGDHKTKLLLAQT